jgi:hypothetical protein
VEQSWCHGSTVVDVLSIVDILCEFTHTVTVQAWGDQARYLDPDLDFDLMWDQVNQYLNDNGSEHHVIFMVPISNLSVPSMEYLFSGMLGLRQTYNTTCQRVWIETSIVNDPPWQSPQILPQEYADHLDELWAWMLRQRATAQTPWHGFLEHEIQHMDNHITWMRQGQNIPIDVLVRWRRDFYQHHCQRNINQESVFLAVFPEMREWWNLCQECATKI